MTIGKRLMLGFGSVVGALLLLFIVNVAAGWRESSARNDAKAALENKDTIAKVQLQVMVNRHNLDNFLLSGDPRDEEKVNRGIADLSDAIKHGQEKTTNQTVKDRLSQVEGSEISWADNFAKDRKSVV